MKRLAAIAMAALLSLTGCGPTFPTIDSAALAEAVARVQGYTVEVCQYLPTNESVVAILTTGEVLETAYAIAQHICAAVTEAVPPLAAIQMQNPRMGDTDQCPMVRGVCVEGRFVGKEAPKP